MKNILNKTNGLIKIACVIGITVFSVSCDDYFEFDLPESNSIEDTIFPTADFSYMPDVGDFTKYILQIYQQNQIPFSGILEQEIHLMSKTLSILLQMARELIQFH